MADESFHEENQRVEAKNETHSESSSASSKEELYRGITIGIVLFGLLLIILLIFYVIRENRRERKRREKRHQELKDEVGKDNPPTYAQIVLRKDPPEYHESVMQSIHPATNPHWSPDTLQAEVRDTIVTKVQSQAHGLYYRLLGRTSQYNLTQEVLEMNSVAVAVAAGGTEGSSETCTGTFPPRPVFILGGNSDPDDAN